MSWLDTFFTSKNYNTVQDEGADIAPQPVLDFTGSGVAVTNDPTNSKSIVTITAGGTTPTGTGVRKVVAGVEQAAASTIVDADVNLSAALAVSKLAPGTNTYVLTTTGGVAVWAAPSAFTPPTGTGVALVSGGALVGAAGAVNLASSTYVSGILPVANGGTGLSSLATFATLTGSETFTNKTLTSPVVNTPNFGSSPIATSGYFATSGNVSTVGTVRFAHGDKICYRNGGNSADATFMHTNADTLYIGLNSTFTDTAFNIIQCPSNAQYIGVASNYFLIITNNLLEVNAPVLGYNGAEFCVHGAVVSSMTDANYTVPSGERSRDTVTVTTVLSAGRTMTWPHPSSMDRSYKKLIFNSDTTQTLTISTGTGTTKTLATGLAQWFEFTTAGVRSASATFTP